MKITYTKRNDEQKVVWIEVNLDFSNAPEDTLWMLWAFAPLQSVGGVPDDAELERLAKVVLELEASLELSHGAEYAGMRIQDGWAELYFYAVFSKGAEKRFREAFRSQGYTQIEFGVSRDAGHAFYAEQLYPDVFEMQEAKSMQIIAELSDAGDVLETSRPVEHYLFFQTKSAMQRTAEKLAEQGRVETGLSGEGEYPHGCMLELEHACTPEALKVVTIPLIEAAQKAHGSYVGWSTALASDDTD